MNNRISNYTLKYWLYNSTLAKVETLVIPEQSSITINDAIEYVAIYQCLKDGVQLKSWSEADCDTYVEKSKKLYELAHRFFRSITSDNIIDYYNEIDVQCISYFWYTFNEFKMYETIRDEVFASLINGARVSPYDIFVYRDIVRRYGDVLCNYILNNDFCVSLLLHAYENEYTDIKYYLPQELAGDDIRYCFQKYIDSANPHINYLQEIAEMSPTKQFPITDEIRLMARHKYNEIVAKMSENAAALTLDYKVSISSDQEKAKDYTCTNHEISISYSENVLSRTLNYPQIFANFVYVFEFVDFPQMRWEHVTKSTRTSTIERIFVQKSPRAYNVNKLFELINNIATMQMRLYYEFLRNHNVFLEDVLRWFFTEYLQTEFGCPEIRLVMPSSATTYREKCVSILATFESMLKQLSHYIEKGKIDFELVGMSTSPIRYEDVKSQVTNKYIYGAGTDYEQLTAYLFSDQSILRYNKRLYSSQCKYTGFIDYLLNEAIKISDYREDYYFAFDCMKKYDIIDITATGEIHIKDKIKLGILFDLYQNEVINRWHYSLETQYAFEDYLKKGLFTTKSTLFSQPETDYLNYLLNRTKYNNGLEIRNRYMHGNQQVNTNEEEHFENYLTLLRLFVLVALKVQDDFLLKELQNNE